jgi:hypothetical protein
LFVRINEHVREADLHKQEDNTEGEELKKLAESYEREKQRLDQIRAEERRQLMMENRQQIMDSQKMKELRDIQEEVTV